MSIPEGLQLLKPWEAIHDTPDRGCRRTSSPFPFPANVLAAMAKQQRVRLGERVRAGLERVKASGKPLGRPREQLNMPKMRAMRSQGLGWQTIAREMRVSYQTVRRALTMSGKSATASSDRA